MLSAVRKLFRRDAPVAPAAPTLAAWRTQGNEALAAGDLERAESSYLQGTQPPPGDPMAWLNLGYVQIERGDYEQARASLRTAESLLPKDDAALADVWALMGRERQERGEWGAAAAAYRRVVGRMPMHEAAWRELGQVCEMQGELAEAETAYTRALAARGDFEPAVRDLARLLARQQRDKEALPLIQRCMALPHPDPETFFLHASVTGQRGRWADALAAIDAALPGGYDERLVRMRAKTLMALRRYPEALASQDQVLAEDASHVESLVDSAAALGQLARWPEAQARIDRALALEPDADHALATKASLLLAQLRVTEALALLEGEAAATARKDPQIAFLQSFLQLLQGDYERGWKGYEARWQLRHRGVENRKPELGVPEWSGDSLAGRSILVYHEQGLGDSIQFLRFLPLVAAQAQKVWLRIQRPLWPVLGQLPANCELLEDEGVARIDCACPLMSLAKALGTTLATIPAATPYLRAPEERIAHWRNRLGPRRHPIRVGVAWSGNPDQSNDHNRSMPLAALRQAAEDTGDVEFISLQKDVRPSEEPELAAWPQLRHFGPELESFGDTAALATLVDLVISVDTSVAHLAGALGRPLAVLLTFSADWRWLLERSNSPWYPTARLYRQDTNGEWAAPLSRALQDIPQRAFAA